MALNLRSSTVQEILRGSNATTHHCQHFIKQVVHHERTQFALQIFGSYAPFILCSLIAFIIASNSGLKYWIALQRTPPPYRRDFDAKKQLKLVAIVLLVSILSIGVIFYLDKVALAVEFSEAYFAFTIGMLMFIFCQSFLSHASGWVPMAAYRKFNGRPDTCILNTNRINYILLTALSTVIAISAVGMESRVASWVGLTAFTFFFSRLASNNRLLTVTSVVYILAIIFAEMKFLTDKPLDYSIELFKEATSRGQVEKWYWLWFLPAFVMALPGLILSLLLRFDYQQHLEGHPEDDQSVYLKTISSSDVLADFAKTVATGVVIPSKTPKGFRKTYFNTALTAWFFTQLLGLVLTMFVKSPREDRHSIPVIGYLFNFVSPGIQIMCLATWIKAYVRGEHGKLMAYSEIWVVKPVPLPAIEVTCPEEEEKEKELLIEGLEV